MGTVQGKGVPRPAAMRAAAAIGLYVRPGRAVLVILSGTRKAPQMVLRHEIHLADPWVRDSMHPYHRELRDHGPAGTRARRRGCAAARTAVRRVVRQLVAEMRSHGLAPRGAVIVAKSLVEPVRVAGAHPRAHAEEEKLYREAVQASLRACGLRVATILEKNVRSEAVGRLRRTAPEVNAVLKAFSHEVGTPWRGVEKNAALAAWLTLPR